MGAITGTIQGAALGAGGNFKLVTVTATVAAASDTITLTEATSGIKSIAAVVGAVITAGADAAFSYLQVSASGLVITIVSLEQDGTAATDFTGTTVAVTVLGKTGEGS